MKNRSIRHLALVFLLLIPGCGDAGTGLGVDAGENNTNANGACGNGVREAGEVCDGSDLGGATCVSQGFDQGDLACESGCRLDLSGCVRCEPEVCDGEDNDCDGVADDGDPGGGDACDTGLPGVCAAGTTTCSGGDLTCAQTTASALEVCDGLDNDCNGLADDGDPGSGDACDTGLPGVCAAGTTTCSDGGLTCAQTTASATEICDGLDNDCNGLADDGDPGSGDACDTGLLGVCAAGTIHCHAGSLRCVQSTAASDEVCDNGEDDDCDGAIDEDDDEDGDGFGRCTGDCCDSPGACSSTPERVNPGAFEFVGNGVDDDCDPLSSDTEPRPDCAVDPKLTVVTGIDLARAMDLCNFTSANPSPERRKWGVITAEQVLADGQPPTAAQLSNHQDYQSAVLAGYGTTVVPWRGATLAGLSTGRMRDENDVGYVVPQQGTSFGVTGSPPPAFWAAHGNTLPSSQGCNGACASGNDAQDSVNVRLTIRVPTNATGFSYRWKFYSSEYPEWICSTYNDFHLALLTSTAPGIPADHNIAFDAMSNPITVNSGSFEVCQQFDCYLCPAGTVDLAGTGMQDSVGGGTRWMITTAPVVAGETITLELMVFDVGDGLWDSLVLLDDFQWNVNPAAP